MATTNIEWTQGEDGTAGCTWNPVVGCTMVSPGCARCYAETMSKRIAGMARADIAAAKNPGRKEHYLNVLNDKGRWNDHVELVPEALADPFGWRKPRKVFVNSMSDLFHEAVPFDFIDKVFAVMALTPQHTYQVLTKRPERMAEYLLTRTAMDDSHRVDTLPQWYQVYTRWFDEGYGGGRFFDTEKGWDAAHAAAETVDPTLPIRNLWLGTSVEDQPRADERIPHLTRCPAAVLFLSIEPLLGRVDWLSPAMTGNPGQIRWVIVGSESGPGRREMKTEWAESIASQCKAAHVALFMKQMVVNGKVSGEPSDFPKSLRIRQFPKTPEVARA